MHLRDSAKRDSSMIMVDTRRIGRSALYTTIICNLVEFNFELNWFDCIFYFCIMQAEPLSQNLFFLEQKRWQPLRAKLTPIFTTRKLKNMFALISENSDYLVNHIEKLMNKNESIECREIMAKYTTDCIGSCVFGVEMSAMSNEESEFRRIGKNVFYPPWLDLLRAKIKLYSPWFYDILGHILPDTETTNFFIHLVVDNINYREKNNISRNDFIDMLREIKKQSDKADDIGKHYVHYFVTCHLNIFLDGNLYENRSFKI